MVPRHWLVVFAASLPVLAGACADRTSTPTGPREALATAAAIPACSFSTAKDLATNEFQNGIQKQAARDLVDAMQAAGQYTAGAKSAGFSIMALIATAKKQNTAKDAATGSSLTNQLILCMFDPASGSDNFPATFPVDFTTALDRTKPGAYEVRGPTSDAQPVLSFPTTSFPRISGFSPTTSSWSGVLSETTLIYGNPVLLPNSTTPDQDQYEWKTIRPGVNFQDAQGAPGIVVGLCSTSALDPNDLMNETEVGYLTLVLNPPSCTATFSQLRTKWGPLQLVQALQRFGSELVRPEPAFASNVAFIVTTGGLAKGGKSIFSKKKLDPDVAAVQFQFVTQPSSTTVGTTMSPAVQVQATYQGDPVANVLITLGGITNAGTPTEVRCGPGTPVTPCRATTQLGGIATFENLIVTKSGAQTLLVTDATITNRSAIAFAIGKRSIKVNIRPK